MPSERGKGVTVDKTWDVPFSRILDQSPGGGTPIHYLYGYVPPNGVVILKLLI